MFSFLGPTILTVSISCRVYHMSSSIKSTTLTPFISCRVYILSLYLESTIINFPSKNTFLLAIIIYQQAHPPCDFVNDFPRFVSFSHHSLLRPFSKFTRHYLLTVGYLSPLSLFSAYPSLGKERLYISSDKHSIKQASCSLYTWVLPVHQAPSGHRQLFHYFTRNFCLS